MSRKAKSRLLLNGVRGRRTFAKPKPRDRGEIRSGPGGRQDAVKKRFVRAEDPSYSADGPGTTSFALRKGAILCLVSAGAPSGFEDGEFFTDEIYELDARCAADLPARERRP
jgi:hypothetical protein